MNKAEWKGSWISSRPWVFAFAGLLALWRMGIRVIICGPLANFYRANGADGNDIQGASVLLFLLVGLIVFGVIRHWCREMVGRTFGPSKRS